MNADALQRIERLESRAAALERRLAALERELMRSRQLFAGVSLLLIGAGTWLLI